MSQDQITALARGTWQRDLVYAMLSRHGAVSPVHQLRGRAKSYSMRYDASWRALLARLATAGLTVERTPGARGGEYTAVYRIVGVAQ